MATMDIVLWLVMAGLVPAIHVSAAGQFPSLSLLHRSTKPYMTLPAPRPVMAQFV